MSFTSPIWLVGLLPWAALAAWLLSGRRQEARVPFVHLWPSDAAPLRARRMFHRPPAPIICLLLALLLAVLAAAGPQVRRERPSNQRDVTLVVDLHLTSPARAATSLDLQPARVVLVRGGATKEADASIWRQQLGGLSSMPTLPTLRAAVRDALARDPRPIVVLSNQRLEIDSSRVVQISSDVPLRNVGIVRLAARAQPAPQLMLTLRNQSPHARAELSVSSESDIDSQTIDLPPSGGERSYFIDLPTAGRVLRASLEVDDDIGADNHAWLVRRAIWPVVEARGELPAEVLRAIDAHRRLRPADEGSKRVIVTSAAPARDQSAALVERGGAAGLIDGPPRVADHPIVANVDWTDAIGPARASDVSGVEWTPLVRSGQRTLVAVRERPARQVWIGFWSDTWPRYGSFVIFWSNVFDWLGEGGGDAFASEAVQRLGPEWRRLDELSGVPAAATVEPAPGIWGRGDGEMRALNAIDIALDPPPPPPLDWRARLAALQSSAPSRGATLAKPALVAALGLGLIASLTWGSVKRGPVTA